MNNKNYALINHKFKVNTDLTQNNFDRNVIGLLTFINGCAKVFGSIIVAEVTETALDTLVRRKNNQKEEIQPDRDFEIIRLVFLRVARELAGQEEPSLINNEIVKGISPIHNNNGNFTLNSHQLIIGFQILSGGRTIDFKRVNTLTKVYCINLFNIYRNRTTITLSNPEWFPNTPSKIRSYTYTVAVEDILNKIEELSQVDPDKK